MKFLAKKFSFELKFLKSSLTQYTISDYVKNPFCKEKGLKVNKISKIIKYRIFFFTLVVWYKI